MPQIFTSETLRFLAELGINNEKNWFTAHKKQFEEELLHPFQHLVTKLAPVMSSIDQNLETAPFVDKTISRIYRDTRFSKDKSPYRNNMWITFRRREPEWQDGPCWFFELCSDKYRFGMGYYQASPATMNLFREKISKKPQVFQTALEKIHSEILVEGEEYKKEKPGAPDSTLAPWFKKKSFYTTVNRMPDELLFSETLWETVQDVFLSLVPLYSFLRMIKDEK